MNNKIKRIYIEITNVCNLDCKFCIKNTREHKFMSLNEFKYIIESIKHITPYIYLHVQGEPLLHPYFIDIINICEDNQMFVNITTNGTLLHKYDNLFKYQCIRKISISMHSFTKFDYSIINIIDLLSKSLNNNQYLELRFWNKNNLTNTSTEYLNKIMLKFPLIKTSKPNSFKLSNNMYLHFDEEFVWPSISKNDSHIGTCKGVKNMLCILSNGDVTPCCLDQDCKINIGNIFKTDITLIINNLRYQNMINNLNKNLLIEPLCQQCTYRNRFI